MIGISTRTYDLLGSMIFPLSDSDDMINGNGKRRCSRTATLDGGCVVYDTGYAEGDRTIKVREKDADKSLVDFAKYITQKYPTVIVTSRDGAYIGVPESYNVNNGTLEMDILIIEKISE